MNIFYIFKVRNYLTNECDIIYECRVCRSIFRSLFNFIMHKRSYCQEKFSHVTQTSWTRNNDDDYLDIIYKETSEGTDTDKVENEEQNKTSKKSLNSIIEGLAQKKQFGLDMQNAFNEQCEQLNNECLVEGRDKEKNILNLESIEGTSSGVFMTLKSQDVSQNKLEKTKVEVNKINDTVVMCILHAFHCVTGDGIAKYVRRSICCPRSRWKSLEHKSESCSCLEI